MTIHSAADLTNTNLGASASFTGPTFDGGSEPSLWPGRVRPLISHLTSARNAHGYLVLEESTGTGFIETRRTPIPADGEAHTFDWPLHTRFHRLRFVNGVQAQTGMRLISTTVRDDGGTMDEQEVLDYFLSATPLGASASFISPTFDLGPNASRNTFRAFARSDQPSNGASFRIEWSFDGGATFYGDSQGAGTVNAGGYGVTIESRATARHCRVVYGNGATAQTAFTLGAALISI